MRYKVAYVNAYRVGRSHGGPEEGGWYYDYGEPLASVPVKGLPDKVCALCGHNHSEPEGTYWDDQHPQCPVWVAEEEAFTARVEEIRLWLEELLGWPLSNRQGRYSVNGGEDFEVYTEDHVAKAFPDRTPHYE